MAQWATELFKQAATQLGPQAIGSWLEGDAIEPSKVTAKKLVTALIAYSEPQVHALRTTLSTEQVEESCSYFFKQYGAEIFVSQTTDGWHLIYGEKFRFWAWKLEDLPQTFSVILKEGSDNRTTVILECRYWRPDFFGITKRGALVRVKRLAAHIDPQAALHPVTEENLCSYV